MPEIKPSVCPHDCPDTCGLLVTVENGRAMAVKGDPAHPFTQGFLCRKVNKYPQRIHSPARLTRPLLRTGPKGGGGFKEIGWDQALDLVAQRLEETISSHGPQAVLPYCYSGHMGLVHRFAGQPFFHRLGASIQEWTICAATSSAGFGFSLGHGPNTDIETAVDSDLILIWGNNTLTSNLHAWPFFSRAREQGARLVAIDPYRNRTAAKADHHLMLKPGTDAALALGLMGILIEKGLVDREFINSRTSGFEELAGRAAEYPPEQAAEICGLPASEIERLALDYGRARAPYIRLGWGPGRQLKGGMAARTVALLPALVGAFEKPGGGITFSTGAAGAFNLAPLQRPDLAPAGTRSLNMVRLGKSLNDLADPPIKLLYVYLANPAVAAPDTSAVMRGLAREDLFTVVQEMFLTETAAMADLVLPGASSLEVTDLYRAYGHYYVQMARPVIPLVGQSRSTLSVFQELAGRMGFGEEVFSANEEEIISWLVETDSPYLAGLTMDKLSSLRPLRLNVPENPFTEGFKTPSGKVEFLSPAMAQAGLDPLPDGAPSLDPEGEDRFPLQLITPPCHHFLNSTFNEIEPLRRAAGEADLILHPNDASARGISQGQAVRVFNRRGECRLVANLSDGVSPGVSVARGLWWGRHSPGGKGANHLTSQRLADVGGSSAFHCNLVEVERATE